MRLPRIVLVTGTDTGVGKTATTAALAVVLRRRGVSVAVYKPVQTGGAYGDSDIAEIARLAGDVTARVGAVLREPLAPRAAAALDRVGLPPMAEHVETIAGLAAQHDHVIVEGAGGLLVELDDDGGTLATLAPAVTARGLSVGVVVVTRAALGTLNHTALTLEALRGRAIDVVGVVVGSVPAVPGTAERSNLEAFAAGEVALVGALPEGAPSLPPAQFREAASPWLAGLLPREAEVLSSGDGLRGGLA
ncbi:dethiobiotin synthase [Sinomonas sp. JGH33]|uniref:ATP-dependent dethiobiotin synthetase BioD n=1 Tax=Sinomonas terricola TaxID=3110330 RepID=A0ABU5T804_9MICC|nr:dethiobiotin synthase [Sinomonas sp. JGH33]MEA5455823.1 dethiobiotin synthase [Sinomonas sp. JGH33]